MLRHLFIILLILIVIGGGVYLYYSHSRQEQVACEQKGGYWNSNTKICEEKICPIIYENIEVWWKEFSHSRKSAKYWKIYKKENL